MVDVPLLLAWVDIDTMVGFQHQFNNALWDVKGSTDSIPLINGQYKPTLDMNSNEWHRFRFLFAAVQSQAYLEFGSSDDGVECEMQLMAKDGKTHTRARTHTTIYHIPLFPSLSLFITVTYYFNISFQLNIYIYTYITTFYFL
jgi:hypothetical protein